MRQLTRNLLIGAAAVAVSAMFTASANADALSSRGGGAVNRADSFIAGQQKTGGVKNASVTFKVPDVDCSNPDTLGVGMGVGDSTTVGAPALIADVFVACVSGEPFFALDAFAGGTGAQSTEVAAGDTIVAEITQDGGEATATVTNQTQDVTITDEGSASADKVLWGAFPLFAGSSDPVGVPDFGKASLKGKVNGKTLKGTKKVNRKTGNTTQIKTGELKKGKFTLTFKDN